MRRRSAHCTMSTRVFAPQVVVSSFNARWRRSSATFWTVWPTRSWLARSRPTLATATFELNASTVCAWDCGCSMTIQTCLPGLTLIPLDHCSGSTASSNGTCSTRNAEAAVSAGSITAAALHVPSIPFCRRTRRDLPSAAIRPSDGVAQPVVNTRAGAHVLMGDGAVIFMTDSVDAGNFPATVPSVDGCTGNRSRHRRVPYGLWGALGTEATRKPSKSS